jgi:nucleoside-triphosphatase THEP1
MKQNTDIWLKASVAGSIWAASEIVFGSFLHNLKIPFSGNILTAVGLIVLISINYTWKDKGLLWRSAVVCALMKTISPSAVIFGPMIAIVSQGFLLEFSTRLLGRTMVGFLLGSMLAMTWNLFQKMVNIVIFYGFDIVELYKSLVNLAQKQLSVESSLTWIPIFVLLILYALFGLFAGLIGIHVGKSSLLTKIDIGEKPNTVHSFKPFSRPANFSYSVFWLFLTLFFIVSALYVLLSFDVYIWLPYAVLLAFIWVIRYKRALRQLKKPYFWLSFVLITFAVAFVFSKINPVLNTADAFLLGLQMNIRAMVMVLGFTVLGTELYNPKIISWFQKSNFKKLHFALELAFESLPVFISALPDLRSFVRKPVSVIHRIIAYSELRIAELNRKFGASTIIIVTAKIQGGKTTFSKCLVETLGNSDISLDGLFTEKKYEGEKLIGYDLVDIKENRHYPFLRVAQMGLPGAIFGRFTVIDEGLHAGTQIIDRALHSDATFVLIDEIGRMELEGMAWGKALKNINLIPGKCFVFTVRDEFLPAISKFLDVESFSVVELEKLTLPDYPLVINNIIKPYCS